MRLLRSNKRLFPVLMALVMIVLMNCSSNTVNGLDLQKRTIQIGTSIPGASTSHFYTFDVASGSATGSIVFDYCSNSPLLQDPCFAPAGLSLSSATLAIQTGETGFAIHPNTSASRLVLSRVPAPVSPQSVSYSLDNVINPTGSAQSFYVRVTTHAADDGTGALIDFGAVVFNTSGGLGIESYVPPFLTFCTGITVAPDCTSQNGDSIDLGELTATSPRSSTSQFAGATNDGLGYSVSMLGTSMTSGNNVINALAVPTASISGTSQYGINLRANSVPNVGQEVAGVGSGVPDSDYNIPNRFTFHNGSLTNSGNIPSEFNTFTVSYMVNIPPGQPPGIYSTTITYIATAAF